jgi:hypothetical protein
VTAQQGPRSARPRSQAHYGPQRGTTYLIHFARPFKHARHYKGWTDRPVQERFADHIAGRGALLTRLATQAGIPMTLARVWPNTTKDREDAIKRSGGKRMCPECGVTPGHTRLPSDEVPPGPEVRRPHWQYDRDGEWADDGTPIIYDPDQTYAQARAEAALHPVPEPGPAGQAELAALDEVERRWTEQEEPMLGSRTRAQRRADREADRLGREADEYARQAGEQPYTDTGPDRAEEAEFDADHGYQTDSPGWESGGDAAAWSPGLGAEVPTARERAAVHEGIQRSLEDLAAQAEAMRRMEARALAHEHTARAAGERAAAEAAAERAGQARQARADAEADAYAAAASLHAEAGREAPGPADPEPGERMDASRSPEAAGTAATQPAGTPHTDPGLVERGWQADGHGVYVRNPDAEAPGPHRELAGYEADSPDHQYGSPECAETDPEGAHFGNEPGEPQDRGSGPQQELSYYGWLRHEMDPEMLEGRRQADAEDAARLAQPGGYPALYGAQPQAQAEAV